ncbi:MAG: gamma carbonic anhydrase family protein, partial [Baileyella intestinalis]
MKDNIPNIDESVFIAPGVQIAGGDEIQIGKNSSIWFNSVIRSSGQEVLIGERSNVQDGSVIHTSTRGGTYIGDDVTIGHMCLIHGCTIGNRTLIGMGSLLMNGVKIGNDCIIGAGSLLTQGT